MRIHAKIENQLKITDLYTAFSVEHTPEYNFRGESHDFWELMIVLDGAVGAFVNSEVHYFGKGQCVLYEPMTFHNVWIENEENATIAVFTFSTEGKSPLLPGVYEIDDDDCAFAKSILGEIYASFNVQGISVLGVNDGCELMAVTAVKRLELLLLDIMGKHKPAEISNKPKRAKVFEQIIKVLEENVEKDLSAEDIARSCNISVSYLQKIFMKYVGMGVIAYFNRMKITYAIIMLQDGMSVGEVSDRLGFSNPNYFSTVFKRIKGESPSAFKSQS